MDNVDKSRLLSESGHCSTQVLPAFIATFGAFGCGTGIAWPSVAQQHIEYESLIMILITI